MISADTKNTQKNQKESTAKQIRIDPEKLATELCKLIENQTEGDREDREKFC